jgi:hypothetical protein
MTATEVDGSGTINNLGDQITFHLHATLSNETNRPSRLSYCYSTDRSFFARFTS